MLVSRKHALAHRLGAVRVAQHAEGVRGPALLHDDRYEPRVGGTAPQEPGQDLGPQAGVEVIDVGLEQDDRLGGGSAGSDGVSAPTRTRTTFARPGVSRLPAPTPTSSTVIAGRSSQDEASARIVAIPVGVANSPAPPARTRQPRASCATAGTGTGRSPWPERTLPDPSATSPAVTRGDAEVLEGGADADHVRDRVQGADLVEVHVLDRDAVHMRLGIGEPGEDRARPVADAAGERGAGQQLPDAAPGPVRRVGDERLARPP